MITSLHNPRIKLVRSLLGRAKERREEGAFLAEGVRLLEEALSAGWPFRFLLYTDDLSTRGQLLLNALQEKGVETEAIDRHLLDSMSDTGNTQGMLAVLEQTALPLPETCNFLLIPDQIRDPGNLGTLLRTALAAGVQAVLLPPETTDAFAPKVVRAGMGAHFRLPILSMDWEQIRAMTERLSVYLADMDGRPCWETDLRPALALIVGGEAEGASQPARTLAREALCIPMPGGAESLNAGVAGAILMFEVVRQRQAEPK
jgi:RNA methyltransferase, TrmH family